MAKKIILIFLGIFILAIGGLTAYVSTIDWNTHKKEIAEKFSEITGEKIEFNGPINVSLLPTPTLEAHDVSIVNSNKPTEKLATITNMSTEASLSSLLKGAPDVHSLNLTGVEIWVDVNDKNEINWKNRNKRDFSDSGVDTRLQSFSIQNALLHYNNDYLDLHFDLTQLNADIQSESLYGPYRLDGNFMKDQDHFGAAISIGDFSMLSDVSLNFAITHPKSESFLRYDGVYMANEQAFKGDFSGGSKKTADFANILTGMEVLSADYNVPLQFSVGIQTDNDNISLSSFIIKYGDFLEGSGSVVIPLHSDENDKRTVDIKYQMVNLDLRPVISVIKAEYETFKKNGSVYEPDTYYDINADLSSERVIFSDNESGYFENVSAKGSWIDNTLSLDEFYAACQGNTVLTMEGSLVEEKQRPQYFLKTTVSGSDFQAFLTSLGLNVQSYTQGAYRNASLELNLSGNNKAVSVNDIKFSMDKMSVNGTVGIDLNENGNHYEIKAKADNLNLDTYLPETDKNSSIVDNLKKDAEALGFLKWLNLHAAIEANNFTFRNASFEKANVNFTTADDTLLIEDISAANVSDSAIKLSGKVGNIGGIDINLSDFNYEFQSADMSGIIEKFSLPWPNWEIFKAKNFSLNGTYQGSLNEGKINIKAVADETKFDYEGDLQQTETFGFNGKATLKTTNFSDFINKVGGSLKTGNTLQGALNCQSNIAGTADEWRFDNTECLLGIANYKGEGKISKDKNKTKITAKVSTDQINFENITDIEEDRRGSSSLRLREDDFISRPDWSKSTVLFDIYRNLVLDIDLTATKGIYKNDTYSDLHTRILNSENLLQLTELSTTFRDIGISGNVSVNYNNAPVIKGNLSLKGIKFDNLSGTIYGFVSGSLDADTSFETPAVSVEDFINNFTGKIHFSGHDILFKGFDFAKINSDINNREYSKGLFQQIRDNLQSGETLFPSAEGDITAEKGSFKTDNSKFNGPQVNLLISGMVGLNEWKMVTDFAAELPDGKNFSYTLSGMINKPGLDINIADIVRQYDEHWQKIEAAEKAEKERIRQELNKKMEDAQVVVQEISELINKLTPQVENYKAESEDSSQTRWYDRQLELLNNISKDTDEMRSKARLPEFTETDINDIEKNCIRHKNKLATLEKQLPKHYSLDLDSRLELRKNTAEELNRREKRLVDKYKQMVENHFNSLLKFGVQQLMLDDEGIKNQQKDFDNADLDFTEKYKKFQADSATVTDKFTSEQKKALAENLRQQTEELSAIRQKMSDISKKFDTQMKSVIEEQEAIYEKKEAEKAKKQKARAAEDADNLLKTPSEDDKKQAAKSEIITKKAENVSELKTESNSASSQTAEELKKDTEDTQATAKKQNNLLRKLEADEETANVNGVIRKSYEKTTTEQNADTKEEKPKLLREVDGAIKKATGKITVK